MDEGYYYECNNQHVATGVNILWECILQGSKADQAVADQATADQATADQAAADQAAAKTTAAEKEGARVAAEPKP